MLSQPCSSMHTSFLLPYIKIAPSLNTRGHTGTPITRIPIWMHTSFHIVRLPPSLNTRTHRNPYHTYPYNGKATSGLVQAIQTGGGERRIGGGT